MTQSIHNYSSEFLNLYEKNKDSQDFLEIFPQTTFHKTKELLVATCTIVGDRGYQEDTFDNKLNISTKNYTLHSFAIFDGHVGGKCSKFMSENFNQNIQELDFDDDEAIKAYFLKKDQDYLDHVLKSDDIERHRSGPLKNGKHEYNSSESFLVKAGEESGSTCTCLIVKEYKCDYKKDIICMNVGDSPAFMSYNRDRDCERMFDILYTKHNPNDSIEKNRIIKAGSIVECNRIGGHTGLNLSRSFGDFHPDKRYPNLKPNEQPMSIEPDIKRITIDTENSKYLTPSFIVIGTDGLNQNHHLKSLDKFVEKCIDEQKKGLYYIRRRNRYKKHYKVKSLNETFTSFYDHYLNETEKERSKRVKSEDLKIDLESIVEELVHYAHFFERYTYDNITATIILFR